MVLKKLSITEQEAEKIRELALNKMSSRGIAVALNRPQATIWRNMEFMGLTKKINEPSSDTFNWKDFNNTVI